MGRILTKDAQKQREKFQKAYDGGNCTCFQRAPCGSCTHRGNPNNQEEDDDSWVHTNVKIFPLEEGGFELQVHGQGRYEVLLVDDASEIGEKIMVAMAMINLRG